MSAALLLLALAALCGALALHPFTTYPLSLALLARLRPRPPVPGTPLTAPKAALCVCAYNEAGIIRAKAENMLSLRAAMPDLELLIYVDAATDGTSEILGEFQDRITIVTGRLRHGKSHGMNTLLRATSAEFVAFSDANVFFAADALPALLAPFADAEIGCVCGHLIYTEPDGATPSTGSIYWRLEEAIKDLESRTGSVMGADGSIFAIRRALHHPPPPDIIDDMFVSLSILCDGHRIVRAPAARAFEAAVSRPAEEFHRKIRIACQAFNVHRLLRPRLRRLAGRDRYKYVSHKLLRWLTFFFLAGAVASAFAALAVLRAWPLLAILLAGGIAVLAVGLLRPASALGKLTDIAGAFAATALGVLRSLRGERFQTWTPPSSARMR